MDESLDIGDVARRTGLTSRALRFYEARGLLKPLRTYNGRRFYGPAELERINQIVALKRAGLTLAQIERLIARRPLDLAALVEAQLEALAHRQAGLAEAKALLLSVKSRIDRGEPVDAETFCSLIRQGDAVMEAEQWKAVTDRYLSEEDRPEWAAKMDEMPAGFDQADYQRRWRALSAAIETALPLDPASAEAQAFVDQWFALLKPFSDIATPGMWNGTVRMYEDMGSWRNDADPGFSIEVWSFIREATQARIAAGGPIDGPAWSVQGGKA